LTRQPPVKPAPRDADGPERPDACTGVPPASSGAQRAAQAVAATIAVTDLETTGRSPIRDRVYEVGAVIRTPGQPDREYHRWVDLHDLAGIDLTPDGPNAEALRVGRFWDRHPQWAGLPETDVRREADIAAELADLLDRATLAGVQIGSFDAPFLDAMLARHGLTPTWSYRHLEISSYAACAAGLTVSPGLDTLLEVFGIPVDPAERHTALGDARLEQELLDAARGQGTHRRCRCPARPGGEPMTADQKGRRIVGSERAEMAKDLAKRYAAGIGIRALAAEINRSYGFVHDVLIEAGVTLRQRGGARKRRVATVTTAEIDEELL
jgi:DNA polymerase III epsilon subunit-like protein